MSYIENDINKISLALGNLAKKVQIFGSYQYYPAQKCNDVDIALHVKVGSTEEVVSIIEQIGLDRETDIQRPPYRPMPPRPKPKPMHAERELPFHILIEEMK